ncbi:hypothetical protein VFPPC_18234 [Pochonia chlamydosporia 170]|uniref:Uncharacterized protein n=1 Tax=Pochonia chlamydosporia 170 TaxID=1380566 RepID=A0A219APY5_METCM|nr:hypothetical protein VFPPC_18234 [Pochonia chlamydosporia 170]OWT42622.1 hypothetical protein VFPPC_18234 [Pochonia chlamydosporia 170]
MNRSLRFTNTKRRPHSRQTVTNAPVTQNSTHLQQNGINHVSQAYSSSPSPIDCVGFPSTPIGLPACSATLSLPLISRTSSHPSTSWPYMCCQGLFSCAANCTREGKNWPIWNWGLSCPVFVSFPRFICDDFAQVFQT